jgi:hypothetical protein
MGQQESNKVGNYGNSKYEVVLVFTEPQDTTYYADDSKNTAYKESFCICLKA